MIWPPPPPERYRHDHGAVAVALVTFIVVAVLIFTIYGMRKTTEPYVPASTTISTAVPLTQPSTIP